MTVPANSGGFATPYSRTLGAGNYVIMASLRVFSTAGVTNAECVLISGSSSLDLKNVNLAGGDERKIITLLGTVSLGAPTLIRLGCSAPGGDTYSVSDGRVVALQVGEIH